MEDADVKQLISWIESAQLPYEIDESGTVIICDPMQLESGVEGVESTVLTTYETSSSAGLLSETFDSDEMIKQETGIITIPSPAPDPPQQPLPLPQVIPGHQEEGEGGGEDAEEVVGEEKDVLKELQDGESEQEDLQIPTGQYFLQTQDGQIIQLLGPIDEHVEDGVKKETQKESVGSIGQGKEVKEEEGMRDGGEDGVQILVVGGRDGEDFFLISAGGEGEERIPVSVGSFGQDVTMNGKARGQDHITIQALPLSSSSDTEQSRMVDKEQGEAMELETNLSNSNKNNNETSFQTLEKGSMAGDRQPTQGLASAKSRLPLKLVGMGDGTVVKTDKGNMVAYSVSSLPHFTQTGSNLRNKTLHNIASKFGTALKVLWPVEAKSDDDKPDHDPKRLSLHLCEECGVVLHSDRSLESHRRRYHRAWQWECLVCVQMFANAQNLRTHILEAHTKDGGTYECWRCTHKCSDLEEFLKHRHDTSCMCHLCGKKCVTLRLFQEHLRSCKRKRKTVVETERKEGLLEDQLDHSSSPSRRDQSKGGTEGMEDKPVNHRESKGKQLKRKYTKQSDAGSEVKKKAPSKRQAKGAADQVGAGNSTDQEFQIESKHYSRQMKKLEKQLEMKQVEPQRGTRRAGRDRTHRCYLCFKFFPTAANLATHKETYHQVSSEWPVRVRTDASLEEREEELQLEQQQRQQEVTGDDQSLRADELLEEVTVKEEPPDLLEEFENVTIVMDAQQEKTRVIKPLCVACQTHTTTDFRKQSRWFSKVPAEKQSLALQKFQQFLPHAIDPYELSEPWVLCKKCAILIDKITEMEDKLVSMKHDLLVRVRGVKGTGQESVCHLESSKEQLAAVSKLEESEPNQDKNLAEIEAYMKDTCEIMEITSTIKSRGRPRREQETVKLTPILGVEEEEDCVPGIVKYVTSGVVKKEVDLDAAVDSKPQTKVMTISKGSRDYQRSQSQDETCPSSSVSVSGLKVKEEAGQTQLNSERRMPEAMEGEDITSQTAQLEAQVSVEREDIDSAESFSADILLKGLVSNNTESKNGDRVEEHVEERILVDDWTCESLSSHSNVPSSQLQVPSGEDMDGSDGENSLQDNHRGIPNKPNSEIVGGDTELSDAKADGKLKAAYLDEASMDDDSVTPEEGSQLESDAVVKSDYGALTTLPKIKSLGCGKKRARLQEEREKMCYSTDVDKAGGKPWRCRQCHKGFSSQRGACDHFASAHAGLSHTCQHCPASYVRKRDLIGHYNRVHLNIKPYKCKVAECPETFSSHGELYRHLSSFHPVPSSSAQPTYQCHLCGASFAQKRYCEAHIPVCISQASDMCPYKCPLCQKAFKLPKYMQLHMRSVHFWKDEQYFCELCHKVLTDKRNLVLHMKSHLGQTKTTCKVCGKQFARKSYLWTHMRVHSNERPYKCTRCPKSFKQYSTWKNHERTHTGEKPYQCLVCRSNFSTSSSLSKHMLYAHYKIREFVCHICKKAFISKTKLEDHVKVHTGEKPHKCDICHRAFNKRNNLREHMYVHTDNKRYKCELCGEGFMRRSTVESHILERHNLASDFIVTGKKEEGMAQDGMTVAQYISMTEEEIEEEEKQGEEEDENGGGKGEDTCIVVYVQEETDASGDMQVTVLADDNASGQDDMSTAFSSDCHQRQDEEDAIASNVLSEIVLESSSSTLHPESLITIEGNTAEAMGQVVEIDEAGELRLVTGAGL